MMEKAPEAFRTISEVAEELDVPQHVLRFWETRFNQIKPMKRGGGRRYYRPNDVDLLRGIRQLLYGKGYTIRGVQRILRESGVSQVTAIGRGEAHAEISSEKSPPRERSRTQQPERSAVAEEPQASDQSPQDRQPSQEGDAPQPPAAPAGLTGAQREELQQALEDLEAAVRLLKQEKS